MTTEFPETCLYPLDASLIFSSHRPNQTHSFIVDLQLQYRLKRKQKVLLLLLEKDWEHTSSVGAKLGVNLNMYKQTGLLDYVDLYEVMMNNNELNIDFEAFTSKVFDKIERLPENSILIIDDISILHIVHSSPSDIYSFIDKAMKLLIKKKSSILVGSAVETGDERSDSHAELLKHQADVWLDFGRAPSGFSQNFDGIIKSTDARTLSNTSANYKVQLRTVTFSNI